MKPLFFVLSLVVIISLIIVIPVNADTMFIPAISASWDTISGSELYPAGNAIDGNMFTYSAWTGASKKNALRIDYSPSDNISFCLFTSAQPSNDYIKMSLTPNYDIYDGYVTSGALPYNSTTNFSCGLSYQNKVCPRNGTRYITWSFRENRVFELKCYGSYMDQLEVNFTGTPTTGPAPTSVVFVISNFTRGINAGSQTVLSFGDGKQTQMTTDTTSHVYQNPGNYTVFLEYYNSSNAYSTLLKPNYITIGASNATKTKYFQTIDGTNGNIVLNSSIQLNDVENSSWTNATGLINDGMSSITTLEGHTINAYAQALGYSDSDDLGIINDGQPQYIMMWPTFAKNVSAGNVSLYVTVKDKDTKANIVGAGVTASLSTGGVQSTTTNEAGIAYFIVTNNTVALITAQAIGQGYQTATTTINTGTGSGGSASAAATILLGKNTVIPTFQTVTTLPGGGTPTPTITILPGCEDTISAEGQAKCRTAQSNQGLSFLAANMGDLIMICVFVTMLYLLGIKLGR